MICRSARRQQKCPAFRPTHATKGTPFARQRSSSTSSREPGWAGSGRCEVGTSVPHTISILHLPFLGLVLLLSSPPQEADAAKPLSRFPTSPAPNLVSGASEEQALLCPCPLGVSLSYTCPLPSHSLLSLHIIRTHLKTTQHQTRGGKVHIKVPRAL